MAETTEVAKAGIDLVEKYADKLTDVLAQYSGPAADLALAVGRVAAIRDIVIAVALIVASGIGAKLCIFLGKKTPEWDELAGIPCVVVGVGSAAMAFIGGVGLLDIFAWVGMFHPEIYLAAKALGL